MSRYPETLIRPALLAVLLLAFALRVSTLSSQSLWSDEGISINRSLLPLGEMLETMPVEHAPGYFVLLGGWLRLAEHLPARVASAHDTVTVDFNLRYFSLIPGVLGVALLARLGFDLNGFPNGHNTRSPGLRARNDRHSGRGGPGYEATPAESRSGINMAQRQALAPWLALVAGVLAAVHPTLHWYAQEGRMYTWLAAGATLSLWALWRLLHSGGRSWRFMALYALATALLVYLHYYAALIPIAQAIYVAFWAVATRRWQRVVDWLIASTVAFLLFAPWLPRALGVFGFRGWREEGVVSEIPFTYAKAYLVGYLPQTLVAPGLLLFGAVALLGAGWWIVRRAEAALLLLLSIAVPLGAVVAMALLNPDFHPRYTLYVVPPLLLLVAAGVVGTHPAAWRSDSGRKSTPLWMVAPLLLATLLVGANLYAGYRQQFEPALAKPDFKGAVQRIAEGARSGDVILVDGPDPELVVEQYYRGDLPLFDLRDLIDAPGEEIDATLRADTAGAERIWEILYFHEPAGVQVWTATQAFSSAPTIHQGIRVTLYGLETPDLVPVRLDLPVGEALTLITATVQSTATASDPTGDPAGDLVRVRTDWQTNAPAPELRFSLRLVDGAGVPVVTDDYVPQNWFAPTNVWVVDASARDQRALLLPEGVAPGEYTITLRLYDPASGVPIATALGEDIPLGRVEVLP